MMLLLKMWNELCWTFYSWFLREKCLSAAGADFRRMHTTSEISVRASESELGRNQNGWIDVSCLHWSQSLFEIFVSDVRVRARRYM